MADIEKDCEECGAPAFGYDYTVDRKRYHVPGRDTLCLARQLTAARTENAALRKQLEETGNLGVSAAIKFRRRAQKAEEQLAEKDAKIAELEAIVEKLDKTEDGVPILLKMHIWDILSDEPSEYVVAELRGTDAGREVILVNCEYRERECAGGRALYSTQDAADKAKAKAAKEPS